MFNDQTVGHVSTPEGSGDSILQHKELQFPYLDLQRKRIGVVLVHWNSGSLTSDCIASLRSGTIVPDEIVVVDNASADGAILEALVAAKPSVHLIRNSENRGFASANNSGIRALLGMSVDYIWILNNDTVVDTKCCENLLLAIRAKPDAAAISALIYYINPKERLWYAGGYRHDIHLGIKHHFSFAGSVSQLVCTQFVSGCCMFTSAESWLKLGGFDENYIAYSEDNDWCWRARIAGRELYLQPEAILWHHGSASVQINGAAIVVERTSPQALFLMIRNNLWTIRRHGEVFAILIAVTVACALAMKTAVHFLLIGRRDAAASCLKGMVAGLGRLSDAGIPSFAS